MDQGFFGFVVEARLPPCVENRGARPWMDPRTPLTPGYYGSISAIILPQHPPVVFRSIGNFCRWGALQVLGRTRPQGGRHPDYFFLATGVLMKSNMACIRHLKFSLGRWAKNGGIWRCFLLKRAFPGLCLPGGGARGPHFFFLGG